MIYNFDICPDRRQTDSDKWSKYPEDVLPLWVADMDFVSPAPVLQALHERIEHGVLGYPNDPVELKELIVTRLAQRYQWQIQKEDILFLPGVIRGFNVAGHLFYGNEGGEMLIQTPVYPPIRQAPANSRLVRKELSLAQNDQGHYFVDPSSFKKAVNKNTRLFILCNPHNPVGRVFSKSELEQMAETCLQHDVTICSDEIHCDLVYPGYHHIPIASLDPEVARHTITLMAPSKTFNIAGLNCSFAVIQNPELRLRFKHSYQGMIGVDNLLGWTAAIAAYREGQEWLDQVLIYLQANRDYLYQFANSELPGIKMVIPEGTYLAWLDCRQTGIEQPYEFFLKHARVALNDGVTFGQDGTGFVRINFACSRSVLQEALVKMKQVLVASV